jgi:predicted DNA-binding transcriptional regulator AlpA
MQSQDGMARLATPLTKERSSDISVPGLVLTEDEAARLLRLSARTLQRLRLEGEGPRFVRLTGRRIGYAISDLEAWVRARSVASTSEAGRPAGRPV